MFTRTQRPSSGRGAIRSHCLSSRIYRDHHELLGQAGVAWNRLDTPRLASLTTTSWCGARGLPEPILFVFEHADGLRVCVFTLNGLVTQWIATWRHADSGEVESIVYDHESEPVLSGFARQMRGIEEMVLTGKPAWPVERTLLTSGALDAALISKKGGRRRLATPYLPVPFRSEWEWRPPSTTAPAQGR